MWIRATECKPHGTHEPHVASISWHHRGVVLSLLFLFSSLSLLFSSLSSLSLAHISTARIRTHAHTCTAPSRTHSYSHTKVCRTPSTLTHNAQKNRSASVTHSYQRQTPQGERLVSCQAHQALRRGSVESKRFQRFFHIQTWTKRGGEAREEIPHTTQYHTHRKKDMG
jgi:hypothetical protein